LRRLVHRRFRAPLPESGLGNRRADRAQPPVVLSIIQVSPPKERPNFSVGGELLIRELRKAIFGAVPRFRPSQQENHRVDAGSFPVITVSPSVRAGSRLLETYLVAVLQAASVLRPHDALGRSDFVRFG
jgi:hypothetical protein